MGLTGSFLFAAQSSMGHNLAFTGLTRSVLFVITLGDNHKQHRRKSVPNPNPNPLTFLFAAQSSMGHNAVLEWISTLNSAIGLTLHIDRTITKCIFKPSAVRHSKDAARVNLTK